MRSRDILLQGRILFASSVYSMGANMAFNMFMSRKLGVVDFGILGSLLSVFLVISIPLQTLQTVLTRAVAQFTGQGRQRMLSSLHGHAWLIVGGISLGVMAAGIATRLPLSRFLHLEKPELVLFVSLMIVGALASTLVRAFLQGSQRFDQLGHMVILDTTLRLGFGVFLVSAGWSVAGAVLSSPLGNLGGVALGFLFLSVVCRPFMTLRPRPQTKEHLSYAIPVSVTLFLYTWLTTSDVAFVRHWFPGEEAGYYSAASRVGMVFMYGPNMLTTYMFPKAAYMHSRNEDVRHLLRKTLQLGGYIILGSLALCVMASPLIVHLLFGSKYSGTIRLLPFYALAMTPMAYNWILINYFLAVGRYDFLAGMVAAVALFCTGFAFFHHTLWEMVAVVGVSGLLLLVWNVFLLRKGRHRAHRP
jgi:O-antigen/teichoic acid export membrane protein